MQKKQDLLHYSSSHYEHVEELQHSDQSDLTAKWQDRELIDDWWQQ
jgi:hypothetical protein